MKYAAFIVSLSLFVAGCSGQPENKQPARPAPKAAATPEKAPEMPAEPETRGEFPADVYIPGQASSLVFDMDESFKTLGYKCSLDFVSTVDEYSSSMQGSGWKECDPQNINGNKFTARYEKDSRFAFLEVTDTGSGTEVFLKAEMPADND